MRKWFGLEFVYTVSYDSKRFRGIENFFIVMCDDWDEPQNPFNQSPSQEMFLSKWNNLQSSCLEYYIDSFSLPNPMVSTRIKPPVRNSEISEDLKLEGKSNARHKFGWRRSRRPSPKATHNALAGSRGEAPGNFSAFWNHFFKKSFKKIAFPWVDLSLVNHSHFISSGGRKYHAHFGYKKRRACGATKRKWIGIPSDTREMNGISDRPVSSLSTVKPKLHCDHRKSGNSLFRTIKWTDLREHFQICFSLQDIRSALELENAFLELPNWLIFARCSRARCQILPCEKNLSRARLARETPCADHW